MLRLVPIVKLRWHEHPFDWAPSDASREWVVLDAGVSSDDIAWVVAMLASYNGVDSPGSVEDAARAAEEEADALLLPGGLLVRTDNLEIRPSCCCGLESWREWYGVAPGGSSPWLGHSPSPWVECKADCAVIWADCDLGDQSPSVSVSYAEVGNALELARVALVGFTAKLSGWLSKHGPQGAALSRRFAAEFDVS